MPPKNFMARRTGDHRADPVIADAVEQGYLGSDEAYIVPDMPGHATANEARKLIRKTSAEHAGLFRRLAK